MFYMCIYDRILPRQSSLLSNIVSCYILFYCLAERIAVVQIVSVSLFCITFKLHTIYIFEIVLQIIFCTCVGFQVLTVVASGI
jgi:hypothetical protein